MGVALGYLVAVEPSCHHHHHQIPESRTVLRNISFQAVSAIIVFFFKYNFGLKKKRKYDTKLIISVEGYKYYVDSFKDVFSSHLIHVLYLCVLIRLRGMAFVTVLPFIILILTLNLHLHLLTLAIFFVTLLDQDASTKLFWCGRWGEVA